MCKIHKKFEQKALAGLGVKGDSPGWTELNRKRVIFSRS